MQLSCMLILIWITISLKHFTVHLWISSLINWSYGWFYPTCRIIFSIRLHIQIRMHLSLWIFLRLMKIITQGSINGTLGIRNQRDWYKWSCAELFQAATWRVKNVLMIVEGIRRWKGMTINDLILKPVKSVVMKGKFNWPLYGRPCTSHSLREGIRRPW